MSKVNRESSDVASTITISNLDHSFYGHQIGVTFYSEAGLENVVTPSEGTVTINGIPTVNGYKQQLQTAVIDVSLAPGTITRTDVGLEAVEVVPSGVVGATHYEVKILSEAP